MIVSANKGLGVTSGQALQAAGGTIAASAVLFGPAAPFVAAAGALVALAGVLGVGNGCGQPCVQATAIVNNAEPNFLANLEAYENGQIDQATAISNYEVMMNAIKQACSVIPGNPGQNCVSDRFTVGGGKWKATSQPYPASPPVGANWNWDSGYYEPLLAPPVTSMTPTASSAISSTISNAENFVTELTPTEMLIGAGLIVAALVSL